MKYYQNEAERLREKGFVFQYDWRSYSVRYKDKFITGAAILNTDPKTVHWRHRQANTRDNFLYCIRAAQNHLISMSETT